jgi:hypothetical protein
MFFLELNRATKLSSPFASSSIFIFPILISLYDGVT